MKPQVPNPISVEKQMGGEKRKKTVREQKRQRFWIYYVVAVVLVWTVFNLLRPGDVTAARIIGIVLGGFVIGVITGYLVKIFYQMKRVVKHRRIIRKRKTQRKTQ